MVPNLIWAPDFFGPQDIWSPRNLGPEKFGPQECWSLHEDAKYIMIFMQGINYSGPKFLRDQISWGPKMSGAQM